METATAALARDTALAQVSKNAGTIFLERARAFVLTYLAQHGPTAGERLTDACVLAGITPHDTRAFGHVYRGLAQRGQIEKCGSVPRVNGHLTSGGNVWRLTSRSPHGDGCPATN